MKLSETEWWFQFGFYGMCGVGLFVLGALILAFMFPGHV